MKKIYILFIILFLLPQAVKADLTSIQQEDIAMFAKEFILEGNKRISSDGFPIFAYMQGQARIDGYQGKMYYVSKDYQSKNTVGAKKWTFDCASFASYVYYHTYGLVLTTSNTKNIDPYSGLTTMNPTGNPYLVSTFVEDADNNRHFYNITKNIAIKDIDFNNLKKGDLIIFVGSHIMVYVGDGMIAHASTSAITNSNLGLEVVKLKDKYPSKTARIIRIKDKIIPPTKAANMSVTWPDNGKVQVLGKDDPPKINIINDGVNNNKISYLITINDDFDLKGYNITNQNTKPTTWNEISGKTYTIKYDFDQNGTYYVYAIDSRKQVSMQEIKVDSIYTDTTPPLIEEVTYKYDYNTDKFGIEVTARDESSITYSLDGINYNTVNYFENLERKNYTLHVKDIYENISTREIIISNDLLPQIEAVYQNEYQQEIDLKIIATHKDGIKGYNLTKTKEIPKYFNQYSGEVTQKIIENGTYYIWVSTKDGIVNYKEILIDKIDRIPPVINNINIKYNEGNSADIEIMASDNACGNLTYSLDGKEYISTNKFQNISVSKFNAFVKDGCNNINLKAVILDFLNQETKVIPEENNNNTVLYIVIISILLLLGVGGYFIFKKIKLSK